jgi:hypothetical protein
MAGVATIARGSDVARGKFTADQENIHIVTDLLKAFLGNGSINWVNMQQWKMYLSGRMLLWVARQQRNNKDAG